MFAFWEYEKFSWQNLVEKVNAKKIDLTLVLILGQKRKGGRFYEKSKRKKETRGVFRNTLHTFIRSREPILGTASSEDD
jgi:hypothetical protein